MFRAVFPVAGLFLVLACGNSPSGTQTIHQGNWSGITADSIPVTFSVSGDSMENITLSIGFEMESHPDTTYLWVFGAGITENQFQYIEINGISPWEFGVNLEGTFTPPNQVQGTLEAYCSFIQGGNTETDSLETSWSATPD